MSCKRKDTLFIVTSGFGDGHRRVAEVLALALRKADPGRPVRIVDLYATLTPQLYPLALRWYRLTLRRAPEILGATYSWSAQIRAKEQRPSEARLRLPPLPVSLPRIPAIPRRRRNGKADRSAPLRIRLRLPKLYFPVHLHIPDFRERTLSFHPSAALAHAFAAIFDDATPGTVVATAPIPLLLLSEWKRRQGLSFPLVYLATDFIPHPVVAREEVDLYFVAHDEAQTHLVALGVPPERIRVTGIPVHPAFVRASTVRLKRLARRRKSDPLCLLVAGGGWGLVTGAEALIREFLSSPRFSSALDRRNGNPGPFLHVLVLGGKNPHIARKTVDRLTHPAIVWKVLPYLEPSQVAALLATVDGFLTKPGGISLAEALAVGVPMFLLPPFPGPEEENARFLTKADLARSGGGEHFLDWLRGISDPHVQKDVAGRQHAAISPHAAERVVRELRRFLGDEA